MWEDNEWWKGSDTLAVVTGANKGIGYEIARLLAQAGVRVVVTSRNEALGQAAADKLKSTPGVQPGAVEYQQLDIADAASVTRFAAWLSATHGRLSILVNNAGIAFKGNTFGADEAEQTIRTNFLGTRAVCEALLPLMASGSRIVNVSSTSGLLSHIPSPELRARLDSPSGVEELVQLGEKFVGDIRAGCWRDAGWPGSMYGVSKALETSYTRVLAAQLRDQSIAVNACCPGYCATDMSSWRGTQSAADGADTPVWLALRPPELLATGGFWRGRQQQAF